MKKPKSPCRADCEYRSAHCHNETRPYGWSAYEIEKQRFDKNVRDQRFLYYAADPLTDGKKRMTHKSTLRRKQKGKL